jgi:hypothetical protein
LETSVLFMVPEFRWLLSLKMLTKQQGWLKTGAQ